MKLCTWCHHPPHDDGCTRTITVKVGKTPADAPCPCNRKTHHG